MTKASLFKLTKAQPEEKGREFGIEVDRRKKKDDLVQVFKDQEIIIDSKVTPKLNTCFNPPINKVGSCLIHSHNRGLQLSVKFAVYPRINNLTLRS